MYIQYFEDLKKKIRDYREDELNCRANLIINSHRTDVSREEKLEEAKEIYSWYSHEYPLSDVEQKALDAYEKGQFHGEEHPIIDVSLEDVEIPELIRILKTAGVNFFHFAPPDDRLMHYLHRFWGQGCFIHCIGHYRDEGSQRESLIMRLNGRTRRGAL